MLNPKIDSLKGKKIIQGGMGAGISLWKLSRSVSINGGIGVVSGTALNEMVVRILQIGDPDGEIRSALNEFPSKRIANEILNDYFIEGGKRAEESFISSPYPVLKQEGKSLSLKNRKLEDLIIASNFVNVHLAKKNHDGIIGINYLHKIQWPLLPAIYGAMLANVDAIFIGAGFPRKVPQVLKELSNGERTSMPVQVTDGQDYSLNFDPGQISINSRLEIPAFLGIVSNHLGVKALPEADGYVFEGHIAGGHNAPAREGISEMGEPKYGPKDETNLKLLENLLNNHSITNLGKRQPYWVAGGYSERLKEAIEIGAEGIQIGTPFAFCIESGMDSELKKKSLHTIVEKDPKVYTSPVASPSGYPFKILPVDGTLSDKEIYESRKNRVCNLGHLMEFYEQNGYVSTRCPAESIFNFVRKGGETQRTVGSVCLCNGLAATAGLGSTGEKPIVTSGSNLNIIKKLVERFGYDYSAKQVMELVMEGS